MGLLSEDIERRVLTWVLVDSTTASIAPQQPINVRLMASNGTGDTPGTEITANSYSPVQTSFSETTVATGVTFVNSSDITYNLLDTSSVISVSGVELWDSSTTPIRVGYATFTSPSSVPAGEPFTISTGQLKVNLT